MFKQLGAFDPGAPRGVMYLIHLSAAHPNGRRPQHYVGWTTNLTERIDAHLRGEGAALMKDAKRLGLRPAGLHVWTHVTRWHERRFKNIGHFARYCPHCRETPMTYTPTEGIEP